MSLLDVRGLSAGYGRVPVLRGVDLHVDPGEVVLLLGPNGAGKSTTLLVLAGELAPTAGTIELLGSTRRRPLDRLAREGVAFLPEGRAVIRGLSVRDNLRLGLGSPEQALALAPELRDMPRRRGGLLSGGEQQILGLARALATEPKLLLADELSLGLAPMVVERMLATVRRAADAGAGVLLVEQHASEALAVADRGYVLRRGEVVLEGSAAELGARIDELSASYLA